MTIWTIHSQLKGFKLLDRLSKVTPSGVDAICRLERVPTYLVLEAMGQLAALHVRHLVDFRRHAFLLKVARFELPAFELAAGRFHLTAELLNQSSNAFAYRVKARRGGHEDLTAALLIGTQAYDEQFQKVRLQPHYRNRFNRMSKDG